MSSAETLVDRVRRGSARHLDAGAGDLHFCQFFVFIVGGSAAAYEKDGTIKAEPSTAATAARTGHETDSVLRIVTDEFPHVIESSGEIAVKAAIRVQNRTRIHLPRPPDLFLL